MKHRCDTCTRKNCADRAKAGEGKQLLLCSDYTEKVETNADRIRAMNDEELAAFLCDRCEYCTIRRCPAAGMCEHGKGKANGLVTWLRQPAEEVQIHG